MLSDALPALIYSRSVVCFYVLSLDLERRRGGGRGGVHPHMHAPDAVEITLLPQITRHIILFLVAAARRAFRALLPRERKRGRYRKRVASIT